MTARPDVQAILDAVGELSGALKGYVRSSNSQHAYSRCVACDNPWWDDRERHNFGCPLPAWREALDVLRRHAAALSREPPKEVTQ